MDFSFRMLLKNRNVSVSILVIFLIYVINLYTLQVYSLKHLFLSSTRNPRGFELDLYKMYTLIYVCTNVYTIYYSYRRDI